VLKIKILFREITREERSNEISLSFRLGIILPNFLSKYRIEYTHKYNYFSYFVWVLNLVAVIEGG